MTQGVLVFSVSFGGWFLCVLISGSFGGGGGGWFGNYLCVALGGCDGSAVSLISRNISLTFDPLCKVCKGGGLLATRQRDLVLKPSVAEGGIQTVDHAVDGAWVVHVLQGGWVALS